MDRILIIEDSKDVNLMLAEVLNCEGYQVKSVFNGVEGMNEANTGEYGTNNPVFHDTSFHHHINLLFLCVPKFQKEPILVIAGLGLFLI